MLQLLKLNLLGKVDGRNLPLKAQKCDKEWA